MQNKNNWKQKVRTGGIRRKILKEYLQIVRPNNQCNHHIAQKPVSTSDFVIEGSVDNTQEKVLEVESETSNTILNVSSNLVYVGSVHNVEDTECGGFSSSESEYEYDYEKNVSFREKLRIWAVKNNISHVALNELSVIINELIPETLPTDSRTILLTPKQITVKNIEGGQYWHNGIAKPLKEILRTWIDVPDTISLNINVDGLPIFRSSSYEFWPILGNIFENPRIRPFVVGIYFGKGKPKSLNDFFEDFVHEMNILLEEGLQVQSLEKNIKIKIRCFICDSPARAYIKGVCNFNGKYGCHKCTTVGEYSHTTHTVTFPESGCPERTNEGFRNKIYGSHHKYDSPLLNLPIDMVNQFVVADSLHLIDLGIMKRLLTGWRDGNFGKYLTKWCAADIAKVSLFLNKCTLPSEVHRAVRGLDSLAHWKASEFRSFLHYLSIVILPEVMNEDAYNHFLTLYCGITICSTGIYQHLIQLAKKLLEYFVEHYKDFYGSGYITSNVHNLLHLTDEVEKFGPLMTFNAYPFENKLFMIKSMLRSGRKPLSQVAKRMGENTNEILCQKHSGHKYPFVTTTNKTNIIHFEDFKVSTKKKDSYLLTKRIEVVKINYILKHHNKISIRGIKINNIEDVFTYPIKSSYLAIYKTRSQHDSNHTLIVLEPKDIKCKLVCVEYKDFQFFIPLLHTLKE